MGYDCMLSVKKHSRALTEMIVLNNGRTFYGLDERTFASVSEFSINTFPGGFFSAHGRLYISDDGARAGMFGCRVAVFGDDLKLIGHIATRALPTSPAEYDGKVFVGSAHMSRDGRFSLEGFDVNGNRLKSWYDLETMIEPGKGTYARGRLYCPVKFADAKRTNHILAIDTSTLERTDLYQYDRRYPAEPFGISIHDGRMIVVYFRMHEIEIIDMGTGASAVLFPARYASLPADRNGIVAVNAAVHDGELNCFLHYYLRDGHFQKIVTFDAGTHAYLRTIDLDARHGLNYTALRAVAGNKVLFGDGSIFNRYSGAIIGKVF